ncbi:SUMF1/EgtB/PvdO family nonheme iron enzyme [Neolewinella persica]|uniref:SUMF1/EgtB/PvdO family nonheme iron enzyme n=1 Tax=Neolewinella persica TaxID=70998 RepID=UPI000368F943|nr:SUMF1/EgtB/PvdO family nonheme iron enzyme [Neolewinella persica]
MNTSKSGKDYAFIFCTADYSNGWTDLNETKTAIIDLKSELSDNYNFQVEVFNDLKLAELKNNLAEINSRNFSDKDQVLFFFTGHGYYKPESDNGYLIPSDGQSKWDYGDGWLSYAKLREYLSDNKAGHLLVAFDACHSGSFGKRTMGKPSATPWEKDADCNDIKRSSLRHVSRLFFSSGNKTERVPIQSEFLKRWLQCLKDYPKEKKFVVTDDDLREYINSVTSSSPIDGDFTGHTSSGKFVFIHKNACELITTPSQVADSTHWAGVQLERTALKANEHIELYGKCLHYEYALTILNGDDTGRYAISGQMVSCERKGDKPNQSNIFYMSSTEVTVKEFKLFIDSSGYQTYAGEEGSSGSQCYCEGDDELVWTENVNWRHDSYGKLLQPLQYDYPVVHISWYDAIAYCNWRSELDSLTPVYTITDKKIIWSRKANGYRLPTIDEWKLLADGPEKNGMWGGANDRTSRNKFINQMSDQDTFPALAPVGSFFANGYGMADMLGNVSEWCWDQVVDTDLCDSKEEPNFYGARVTGQSGYCRVHLGGDWSEQDLHLYQKEAEKANHPLYRSGRIGFRIARNKN